MTPIDSASPHRMRAAATLAIAAAVALWGMASATAARADLPPWRTTLSAETRFYGWERETQGSPTDFGGSQLYVPIVVQVRGRPSDEWAASFLVRTGFASSEQTTPGRRGDLQTMTDTAVTGTFTYYGFKGIQPYASLFVNVPTGRPVLFGTRANARMDYDLVGLATFGEGWNLGPSLGATIAVTKALNVNIGVSYTYRGPYRREGTIDLLTGIQGASRLQSGAAFGLDASMSYNLDTYGVTAGISYSRAGETTFNRAAYLEAGRSLTFSASGWKRWDDVWSSSLSGYFSQTNRNRITAAGIAGLMLEAFNSNSNSYRLGLNTVYTQPDYAITLSLARGYRDDNAWDPETFSFVPQKGKWSAGISGTYKHSASLGLTAKLERVVTHESRNPDKTNAMSVVVPGSGIAPKSGDGWLASIGAAYSL